MKKNVANGYLNEIYEIKFTGEKKYVHSNPSVQHNPTKKINK